MKNNIIIPLIITTVASTLMCLLPGCGKKDKYTPVIENKEERQLIKDGNKLFEEGNYRDAEIKYKKATHKNPNSATAYYNQAVALIKQFKSTDNDSVKKEMMDSAFNYLQRVPGLTKDSTLIAMAYHNLGNLNYESGDFNEAITTYKLSLRHNPGDDDTRYNLRMAQLKLQEQQKQQKEDKQNQENQDKDKQNQDSGSGQDEQNKDQNKQKQDNGSGQDNQNQGNQKQNQDKGQEKNAEKKQQSSSQQENGSNLDERNIQQILKAAQDKEDAVQGKIYKANRTQEQRERQSTRNKW